jgi:chaperonin cofactor prefoldin
MKRSTLTSPTSLLSISLLFSVWNSCAVNHLKAKVELIEKQVDSIEAKSIDASGTLDELKSQIEEVKTAVDDLD